MVTTRKGQNNVSLLKEKFNDYLGLLGRNDITITNYTRTTNQAGRTLTQSTATQSNVKGDLQFDTKLLSEYISMGVAQRGDGFFYTTPGITISQNDDIIVDSVTWTLVAQIEGETISDNAGSGEIIYQGWIARRKP